MAEKIKHSGNNKEAIDTIVIDGKGAILGRLSSFAAKQSLLGKKVIIINSNKVVITGKKKIILERYIKKIHAGKGSQKGPYWSRTSNMMLRRIIRGMLPWKTARGREAFKRIICYKQSPETISNKNVIKLKMKLPLNYITLDQLEKLIS